MGLVYSYIVKSENGIGNKRLTEFVKKNLFGSQLYWALPELPDDREEVDFGEITDWREDRLAHLTLNRIEHSRALVIYDSNGDICGLRVTIPPLTSKKAEVEKLLRWAKFTGRVQEVFEDAWFHAAGTYVDGVVVHEEDDEDKIRF